MSGEGTSLLLVHGLDGNGRLWDDVASAWDRGPVLAPDLAGHGMASRLARYDIEDLAADLAERLGPTVAGRTVVAIGHSLGALTLLALVPLLPEASFQRMVVLSTKTRWSADDLAGLRRPALSAPRWFDSETSARERFLLVTGLAGHLPFDHPAVGRGIVQDADRWRLAVDPATHLVDVPDLGVLFAGPRCPMVLARGEQDLMATQADMDGFGRDVRILPGCGHNPHVERPDAVAALLT